MSEPRIVMNALATHLGRYAYRYGDEIQLHKRIAEVLTLYGFEFERERVLDARNRADFWLDGVVIEVKVGGSLSSALHQVGRYIKLPDVTGVILAGTPRWAGEPLASEPEWLDKPFQMVRLARQSL